MTRLSFFLAVAILGMLPQQLQATHIVGGDMEYDIIDKTDTEVTIRVKLSVYRDCFFGDPTVFFDDPAYVGIFNQSNFMEGNLVLEYTGQDDTLNQGLDTFCLVNLQPVCVHTTTYEGTVTLPIIPGGYTFAYQRCCRNETIANIVGPLFTGATFSITVNDEAINRENDSPEYVDWPPIYICAGEPLVFSHRATDADGDSLVYSLCTPFQGGTLSNPQPIPTNPPPYDTVVWATGYSLDNLLGTGTPLAINPETGLMTAVPLNQGQFVIGVCVQEYDRTTGELLSVVRRDFQYNVNPCDDITANFEAPEIICEDSTIIIQNTSTSPGIFEWYLDGQLVSNSDSSFYIQEVSDTGSYVLELIAVPNTICADTFSQTVSIVNNTIEPDFFFAALNCVDSTILVLSDQSLDTLSTIEEYQWSIFINGLLFGEVTGSDTSIVLPSDVNGEVCLTLINTNGCEEEFCRSFDSTVDNPTDFILVERDVCSGAMVALNPFAPDSLNFNYQWAPADLLDDPTAQNPIATLTDQTTTFSVTITNSNEGCETVLETTITLLDTPTASFTAEPECGGIAYNFINTSSDGNTYFWDFGVTNEVADTSILEDPSFTFPDTGDYLVTLVVTNSSGCTDTITELISVDFANQIGLEVDSSIITCEASVTITPTATSVVTFTYFDMFGDLLGTGPSLTINVSGTQTILVVATDVDDCTESQMVTISGGPVDLVAPDTILACGMDEVNFGLVNTDPNDNLTYVWSPDSLFDPATINDAEPVFTGGFGDFDVSVIATNQFGCADTADINLVVLDDSSVLDFTWEPDCSGSTIMFTNTSTADFGFQWDFGGQGSSNETNPSFSFANPGTYTVTLSTIYGNDCIASISQEVTVTEVVLMAGIAVADFDCSPDGVTINFMADVLNETNDTLIYNWSFMDAVPASSNEENPTVVVSQTGNLEVSLTVISEDDCTSTYDTTINIQLSQVSLLDSVTICPGDSVALNPSFSSDLTYTWSPVTGFDPNDPNPVVGTAGTYTVIASTDVGDINCPAFDTIVVIIADSIALTLTDPDGNIIPETVNNEVNQDGSDMLPEIFTCGEEVPVTANIIDGISIQWTDFDGNPITTDNPAGFNPIFRDTVIAIASDEFGCSVADTVVIVNQQVDAQADPASASISVCATQDTFLGVTNLDPNDTLTFMWEDNPIIISPLDSAYVVVAPNMEGTVQLSVTVSNQFGCDTVIVFDVTVDPFISTPFPDTVNACFDQATALNPGGVAIDDYMYVWSPMDGDFSNPANPIVALTTDQMFFVTITDPNTGCSETDSIVVIVAPDLMFMAESTQDTSLCFSGEVTFSTSSGPNVVTSWYDAVPFMPPPLAVGADYTVELNTDGEILTIYAEAVDTITGCRDTLEFTATLEEFDPGMFPDTVNACFGEDTPLNPGGITNPNYTYTWNPDVGNGANPTVNLMDDMTFFVTVTDPATGCELMDTIFVPVSEEINFMASPTDTALCEPGTVTIVSTNEAGATVIWYDDPALTNEIGSGPTIDITISEPGTITVYGQATESEFGCTEEVEINIELIEFNPNTFPDTVSACFGEDTPLNPGGVTNPNYTYTWEPNIGNNANPTVNLMDDMTFFVTVTDPATGCELMDTIFVPVSEEINFMASPTDTVLCESGTFTVVSTNEAGATVVWYSDPELTNEIGTGPTIEVTVSEEGTVTIYGQATEPEFGCTEEITITATLDILDDGLPSLNPQGCFGDAFVVLFPNGTNPNYEYTFEPNDCLDLSDPSNPVWTCQTSGSVEVTATNPETGCTVVTNVQVDITDLSNLTGTATPDTIVLGDPTQLEVFGCEGDDCTYTWMEPNGTIDVNGSTATGTPDEDGTQVYLVEVNSGGCTEIVEIPVEVIDVMCVTDRVYLPNAFTPNNDGVNDELRVRSEFITQIEVFELMIFNRWGQQMYRSFNPMGSWDGTFNGEALAPDVYGYYLRVICPDGEELIQKGNVTILR